MIETAACPPGEGGRSGSESKASFGFSLCTSDRYVSDFVVLEGHEAEGADCGGSAA